jgi:translation initiation factor IF-3
VNFHIRVPQVRVVDQNGQALGVIATRDAMQLAQAAGLDLVEVAPNANPPVCRIMDYGKFKYEKAKKAKEAKKKQHVVHLKEIKMHPKTEEHDYHFKMEHARGFLIKGDRVKGTVVFRGREIAHIEFGKRILERLSKDLADISLIELDCRMEGRNLISVYLPDKVKIKQVLHKQEIERKRAEALMQATIPQAGTNPKPAQPAGSAQSESITPEISTTNEPTGV